MRTCRRWATVCPGACARLRGMSRAVRAILVLGVLFAGIGAAAAADPAGGAQPAAATPASASPVPVALELGGRTIVPLRAAAFTYRPAERAQGARTRVLAASEKNHDLALIARHGPEGMPVLPDVAVMFRR